MNRSILMCFVVLLALAARATAGPTYLEPIYGYQKSSNLIYGTGATNNGNSTANLRLDLYRPTDIGQGAVPTQTPALVMIHGGGFTTGSKNDFEPIGQLFASLGYVVASIDYRLAGSNPPPEAGPGSLLTPPSAPYATLPPTQGVNAINAAVNDATKAMLWMRNNAATYGVDPNRIGVGGGSAGAITALLMAYNNPAPEATPKVVLSYLGSMYGAQDLIQPGAAPAFIVGGMLDNVVPPSGSTDVAARMNQVGVYNELYMQPGVGHTVDYLMNFGGEPLIAHNMRFLATYLVPEPTTWMLGALGLSGLLLAARGKLAARRQRQR